MNVCLVFHTHAKSSIQQWGIPLRVKCSANAPWTMLGQVDSPYLLSLCGSQIVGKLVHPERNEWKMNMDKMCCHFYFVDFRI